MILSPAGFAVDGVYSIIKTLYHVADDINDYINKHIDNMKNSDNPTISRTGRVLEGAKFGFGIGYITPVVVISVGQLLCGFKLAAVKTVVTAGALSNPVAMTCAALGAIYYGWNALSEQEKQETIEVIEADIKIGAELIKSIIQFVIKKTTDLLSSDNILELKKFVTESAQSFGRTLGDVTGAIKDKMMDTLHAVKVITDETGNVVKGHAASAVGSVKSASGEAGNYVTQKIRTLTEKK